MTPMKLEGTAKLRLHACINIAGLETSLREFLNVNTPSHNSLSTNMSSLSFSAASDFFATEMFVEEG